MSDINQNDTPRSQPEQVSVSRRRALLKGLGRSAALAGAAVPLRSLATGDKPGMRLHKTDGKNYLCSVSGNQSVLRSTGAPVISCAGKGCGYYKTRSNWPKNPSAGYAPACKVGSTYYAATASFFSVFGGGSNTAIGALVDASTPTDEGHWVVAMLNASVYDGNFPYSTIEVRNLYKGIGGTQAASIAFFKAYLESA